MIIVTDRAQLVGLFQYRAGSCHVLEKKSGSGQVRLEVLKYSIRYFRVTYLISGISGYVGYFRVFWVFKLYLMFGCTQNDRYAQYPMIFKTALDWVSENMLCSGWVSGTRCSLVKESTHLYRKIWTARLM